MKNASYPKKRHVATGFFSLLALTLALIWQGSAGYAQQTLPHGTLILQNGETPKTLDVEVASTPAEQEYGMMYRREWKGMDGMLFLWAKPRNASFWMKNTYLPLDMLYIDQEWKIAGWHENAEPLSLTPIDSPGVVIGVLEIPAGSVKEWQLKKGMSVKYVPPGI